MKSVNGRFTASTGHDLVDSAAGNDRDQTERVGNGEASACCIAEQHP